MQLSTRRAEGFGWQPPVHAKAMPDYCRWLIAPTPHWREAFPAFARYGHDPFDYAAEDRALSAALADPAAFPYPMPPC